MAAIKPSQVNQGIVTRLHRDRPFPALSIDRDGGWVPVRHGDGADISPGKRGNQNAHHQTGDDCSRPVTSV